MTRINLVPPSELMDQHLIAEYREIRLLARNMHRSFGSKKGVSLLRIPSKFTLNKGHVLFFANKGKYIHRRYEEIQFEMEARGFKPQFPELDISAWPKEYFNDWKPNDQDLALIRERIALRISQRPGWYRKTPADYMRPAANKLAYMMKVEIDNQVLQDILSGRI